MAIPAFRMATETTVRMGDSRARGVTRGLKRKRPEDQTEEDLGLRISGKLHHHLKEVRKAAKKAKAFETQKLVKKLKGIRRKGDTEGETELQAQLEILKNIDHECIADTAFKTKLKKDHVLSKNDSIQAAISAELLSNQIPPAPSRTPAGKVQSSLLSSKIIAAEVAAVVDDLKIVLDPEWKGTDIRAEETDDREERSQKTPKVGGSLSMGKAVKPGKDGERSELIPTSEGISEDDNVGDAGWESGTVGDDNEAESNSWESGSVGNEPIANSSNPSSEGDSSDGDGSSGDGAADDRSKKSSIPKTPRVNADKSKSTAKASSTQSTFVPSLAVGFTRGDSDDSEWSDSEAKLADGEQKKNRRGQRARRAIWEKKFGKNANHMKKQRESSGHGDARRPVDKNRSFNHPPAQNRRGTSKGSIQSNQKVDSGWGQRVAHNQSSSTAAAAPAVPGRPRGREDKPLHPSWEAKKKQKEMQGVGILPAQGTKIKF